MLYGASHCSNNQMMRYISPLKRYQECSARGSNSKGCAVAMQALEPSLPILHDFVRQLGPLMAAASAGGHGDGSTAPLMAAPFQALQVNHRLSTSAPVPFSSSFLCIHYAPLMAAPFRALQVKQLPSTSAPVPFSSSCLWIHCLCPLRNLNTA